MLASLPQWGFEFLGGAAGGGLATGTSYEINANRQMDRLEDDFRRGRMSREESIRIGGGRSTRVHHLLILLIKYCFWLSGKQTRQAGSAGMTRLNLNWGDDHELPGVQRGGRGSELLSFNSGAVIREGSPMGLRENVFLRTFRSKSGVAIAFLAICRYLRHYSD